LLEDDQFHYTYDANGNRISKTDKATSALTTYTYDVENQLIGVTAPGLTAAYRYDGLGRRIEKAVNGTLTRYLYDQEDIVALFDTAGCWRSTVLHGPGIDQPLAFVQDSNHDCGPFDAAGFREQVRTLQTDGLGSITSLVSETSGFFRTLLLKERYSYDSFGTLTILGPGSDNLTDTADDVILPQSAFGNLYFFAGREFDFESGLHYNRRRSWDPRTGRFLQEDPLFYINRYVYVDDNPVNYIDPSGLVVETPWDVANVALGAASLATNIAGGNVAGAAIDAAGLAYDVFATAVPALPAGASTVIQATRRAKQAQRAIEGVYEFVSASGRQYVGQSCNLPRRLQQHIKAGKVTAEEAAKATRLEVQGGKTAREVVEQQRIDALGGIRSGNLENKVNPIGPARRHLLNVDE
jgi:RHS repeat-associated protein